MQRVSTVDKCFDILEAIRNAEEEGLGVREIARRVRTNPTTVHNICRTLCARGYLRQDPRSRSFQLGVGLFPLARSRHVWQSLAEAARPLVRRCRDELDESILLGLMEQGEILTLLYLPSDQALRVHEPQVVGERAYGTAVGKVLLATLSDDALDQYLEQFPPRSFTASTITDRQKLRRELESVRSRGYALTRDELVTGASAVAVPIVGPAREIVAALGASAPTVRMDARQAELTLAALLRYGEAISETWFGRPPRAEPKKATRETPQ